MNHLSFSQTGWCRIRRGILAAVGLAVFPGLTDAAVEQVVVVFKTHFDIGYTEMASNVVQRYRTTMIDDALAVVDQNRDLPPEQQFVWTLPGWPLAKILDDWPGQTDDRQHRIRDAFRQGRFVVHALPFTTHTELLEPEDLVRGLGYSSRLSRAAAMPLPRDAKMTDVPSHSWILPTLLRHAGVDFLHLGCNAASRSPLIPALFWWEGPDGSRLLTMYTAESYGTGLVPPADWPYRTWLALTHTGDNHGPPRPDEVKQLLEQAKVKLPGVRVRIGRLSDFSDAILAERADIPVVRGDMPDTWIHGPMSDPQGAGLARQIRPKIAMAESLNTLLPAWGVTLPSAGDAIAKAYELSLLYGEHTWGGAYWWIYGKYVAAYGDAWRKERAAGRFDRIESSWAEHTAYIEHASRLIEPLVNRQLRALAKAVHQDGDRMVIFNPLPWPRQNGVALADIGPVGWDKEMPGMLQASADDPPAYYDLQGHQIRCLAPSVPPSGYRVLTRGAAGSNPGHLPTLEPERARLGNARLTANLNVGLGSIASLQLVQATDRSGKAPEVSECVDQASPYRFGQVLYERFDSKNVASFVDAYVKISADWATNELGKPMLPPASVTAYRAAAPTNFTAAYTNSLFAAETSLHAPASEQVPFGVTTRYLFYNGLPYFDIEVTLHQKPAEPWPEAAWICLPFKVDSPQFRLGRLGSIVDPVNDIVPGSNHHLYAVETGLAVFDASGRGFGVCPLDSPLVSLDQPGCWKYSVDFTPGKATVFINLFNNQWTTNFRLWNEGTWTSRVRIWAFDRYDPVEGLIRPALEARFPLQAVCATGEGGPVPPFASGLSLSRPAALPTTPSGSRQNGSPNQACITTFGTNPDGPGTVLRIWELAGESGDCDVHLPAKLGVSQIQPVNLRGQPTGPAIPLRDGHFTAPLRAFAPVSYLLLTSGVGSR